MISRDVVVNLTHDTERAMAELVSLAGEFTSRIHLSYQNKWVNAKSIMGVMTLVSYSGDAITVTAEGSDEKEAVEAISSFFAG
jgi:phosphotransferase system HPr (HPr) family protein